MAIINYNEKNTETTNISVRNVNVEIWKAIKKLAALEEMSISDYISRLVRVEVERINKRG